MVKWLKLYQKVGFLPKALEECWSAGWLAANCLTNRVWCGILRFTHNRLFFDHHDRDTTHHQLPLAKVTPLQKKSHSNLSPLTRDFKILNIGGIHHFVGFCLHQIITNIQGWSWYLYLCHQHWSSLPWNISRGDDQIFIPTFHIDFLNEFQI